VFPHRVVHGLLQPGAQHLLGILKAEAMLGHVLPVLALVPFVFHPVSNDCSSFCSYTQGGLGCTVLDGILGTVLRPVLRAVIDTGDFNGVLLNLVDGDVGRKDQFAPSVHASGAATVREAAQCLAAVIDGFHCLTSGGGIVFRDALKYLDLRSQGLTSGLPLGLEQSVEPLSHLFVREIFAALQRFLAQLDGFNKASFLCEVAADCLLCKRIRVAALLGGQLRELVLLLRREMYFHDRSVGAQRCSVNGLREDHSREVSPLKDLRSFASRSTAEAPIPTQASSRPGFYVIAITHIGEPRRSW